MSDANPYASPEVSEEVALATAADIEQWQQGLYRKGRQLVMHKMAHLPNRCVKTNKPTGSERVCRHFAWVNPLLLLLSLPLAGVPFFVVWCFRRKEATIYLALSDEWLGKRRRTRRIFWWLGLLGTAIGIPCYGVVVITNGHSIWAAGGLALGAAVFLAGAFYHGKNSYMVRPVRITDDHVWLEGVHPDYLADLPPWPNRP
jgi:hypothetical protein